MVDRGCAPEATRPTLKATRPHLEATRPTRETTPWPTRDATPRPASTASLLSTIYEIPSLLNGRHVKALGDTCAKRNFMREDYAVRCGFNVDRDSAMSVAIGSGRKLTTTGVASVRFRFENEPEIYSLCFHLLPNCIYDVILGKPFLKATKTFSSIVNTVSRVKQRVLASLKSYDLLYLGDNAPRFTGLINGRHQEALADTGAKVMIMDEDYAQAAGLPIRRARNHCTQLRFVDGSTALTSGMAYQVDWQFGHDQTVPLHKLDFHILKNAPASVILSDNFLFQTKAFTEYDCYLMDEDDEDEDAYFFAIDIDRKFSQQEEAFTQKNTKSSSAKANKTTSSTTSHNPSRPKHDSWRIKDEPNGKCNNILWHIHLHQ
ncbi:hypothetical protein CC86DRAFT_116678 [Ophiobolus disseminans]|uniref:Uncharacterized protein n=1 Tax=Ophiobolus disseminans TaxID=1469910 RepID=A0A6A6ZHY5_9PLEO|nr:hypothetical protein CC86DRAFT_116678 [Ophiobolus disseminans]